MDTAENTVDVDEARARKREELSSMRFGVGHFGTETEKTSAELVAMLRHRGFPSHLIKHAVEIAWRYEMTAHRWESVKAIFDVVLTSKVEQDAWWSDQVARIAEQREVAKEFEAETGVNVWPPD